MHSRSKFGAASARGFQSMYSPWLVAVLVSLAPSGWTDDPCTDLPCHNACNPCSPPTEDDCGCDPHVPRVAGVVSAIGSWSPSWDWAPFMNINATTQNPEISHAVLLTTGPYTGRVVLWRNAHPEVEMPGGYLGPTETFVWDPANPSVLAVVEQAPAVNNFCGAHTFDETGQLLVLGGGPPETPPDAVYRFDPKQLRYPPTAPSDPHALAQIIEGDPWILLLPMVRGRFYPIVITGLDGTIHAAPNPDLPSGSAIILGGKHPDEAYPNPTGLYNGGTHLIEFRLPPAQGSAPGHLLAAAGTDDLIPAGITPERYVEMPLPPLLPANPTLDYYPRAFHMADVSLEFGVAEKNLFVAHDVIPAAFHTGSLRPSNDPGYSWVFKPRYDAADAWEVWPGPVGVAEDGQWERVYGGAVLFHQLARKNRILQFGGTYAPSTSSNSRWHWRRVEEYYIPAGAEPQDGLWKTKSHCMQTGRAFHNCVILPTGRVLLIGGSWATAGNRERPAVCPELYDPGKPHPFDDATSWRMCARPSPNGTSHPYTRLYHNVGVLLLDGSVLSAGGEDLGPDSDFPNGNFSGEVFYPPYAEDPDRPTIVRVTNEAGASVSRFEFGQPMLVTVRYPNPPYPNEPHLKFVLLRPASVTHHFDADQRYVELEATLESNPALNPRVYRVFAPQPDLGPRGIYTLWAVRNRHTSPAPLDLLPSKQAVLIQLTD